MKVYTVVSAFLLLAVESHSENLPVNFTEAINVAHRAVGKLKTETIRSLDLVNPTVSYVLIKNALIEDVKENLYVKYFYKDKLAGSREVVVEVTINGGVGKNSIEEKYSFGADRNKILGFKSADLNGVSESLDWIVEPNAVKLINRLKLDELFMYCKGLVQKDFPSANIKDPHYVNLELSQNQVDVNVFSCTYKFMDESSLKLEKSDFVTIISFSEYTITGLWSNDTFYAKSVNLGGQRIKTNRVN